MPDPNGRLAYQQAKRRQQMLVRLHQVGQSMSNLFWQEPQRSLERIARTVCERVGADCAVIYPYDVDREGYFDTANVASYGFWFPLILVDKPRFSGMTTKVKSSNGWLEIPDVAHSDLAYPSELIERENIKAFVGLVLEDESGTEVGTMYVNFREEKDSFSDDERRGIREQARQAVSIIQKEQQAAEVRLPELLKQIVEDAKELLEADVVSLYQYRRGRDEEFITPPVMAGYLRFPDPEYMGGKITRSSLPIQLVSLQEPYYADDVTTDPFLATIGPPPDEESSRPRFIEREEIRSAAGVLLRAGDEIVGVMFINYRTPRTFTPELRQEIALFANQAALAIRNARIFEQAETLNEIGQAVAEATLEPERVLDLVLERTLELVGFSKGWISLLDPTTEALEVEVARGLKPEQWRTLEKGKGITGQVAEAGQLMNVPDVNQVPGYEPFFPDTKSELCAPLKYRDEVLGVLNLESAREDAFTQRDEELVLAMANAAAVAIQNARLYERVSQQSDALQRIVAAIGPREEHPLSVILREAVPLFGAEYGSFVLVNRDAEELTYEAIWEDGEMIVGEDIPEDKRVRSWEKGITGEVARTGKAIRTGDVINTPNYEGWYESTVSELAVPLKDMQQRTIGVLNLESPLEDAFSQSEEDLCQDLANVAAAAVEKVELLEELELRIAQLTALSQASQALMAPLDLESVLRQIVEQVSGMHGGIRCGIRLYNAETGELDHRVQTESLPEELEAGPRPGGTTEYVLQGKPLYIADTSAELASDQPRVRQEFVDAGVKAVAYIPLVYQEEINGILYLNFSEPRRFTESDQQTLQLFADQAAVAIENARLYDRLRQTYAQLEQAYEQRNKEIAALQKINDEVTSGDRGKVLRLVAQKAVDVLPGEYSELWLLESSTGDLLLEAAYGAGQEAAEEMGRIAAGAGSINMRVAQSGAPEIHLDMDPDADAEAGFLRLYKEARSSVTVPLKYQKQVIGTLNVESSQPKAFTEEHGELLDSLSDQAAVAIENAKLYEQRSRDLSAVLDVNRAITSQDLDVVAQLVADQAVAITEARYCVLRLIDESGQYLEVWASAGRESKEDRLAVDNSSFTGWVASRRQPDLCNDVTKVDHYLKWYPEVKSCMAAPLLYQEDLIGTLYVESTRLNAFSEKNHLALLESFANQASVAIENARLYEQLQQAYKQRSKEIAALQEINDAVTSGDRDTVLRLVAEKAIDVLPGEYSELWLLKSSTGDLHLKATYADDQGTLKQEERIKVGTDSINMRVAQSGETHICSDADPDSDAETGFLRIYKKARSSVTVPLKYRGQVIGTLNVESARQDAFTNEHSKLLDSFSDQAAVAIENARLYERLEQANEQLQRKTGDLKVLYDMGQRLASGQQLSEPEIIDLIQKQADRLMDTRNMYIALYDAATDTVSFPFMQVDGKPEEVPARSGGHGRTEWIIERKEPLLITTEAESEAWYEKPGHQEYIGEPFSSWIGAPMMVGDEVLGVIAAYHEKKEHVYDEDNLEILKLIANQAAVALKGAQQLEIMKDLAVDLSAGVLDS